MRCVMGILTQPPTLVLFSPWLHLLQVEEGGWNWDQLGAQVRQTLSISFALAKH